LGKYKEFFSQKNPEEEEICPVWEVFRNFFDGNLLQKRKKKESGTECTASFFFPI